MKNKCGNFPWHEWELKKKSYENGVTIEYYGCKCGAEYKEVYSGSSNYDANKKAASLSFGVCTVVCLTLISLSCYLLYINIPDIKVVVLFSLLSGLPSMLVAILVSSCIVAKDGKVVYSWDDREVPQLPRII